MVSNTNRRAVATVARSARLGAWHPAAAILGLALALAALSTVRAEEAPRPAANGVVAVTDLDALRRLWIEDQAIHGHVDCGDGVDHRDAAGAPPLAPEAVAAMLASLTRNLSPAAPRFVPTR